MPSQTKACRRPRSQNAVFERFEERFHTECTFGIWERSSPRRDVLQASNVPSEGSEKTAFWLLLAAAQAFHWPQFAGFSFGTRCVRTVCPGFMEGLLVREGKEGQVEQDLIEAIHKLKEERNGILLAHNYQDGTIQDLADFAGDSLELSRKASETDAELIVFCGVRFMAETASILSPEKTVLLPDEEAGCPMADMITAEELRRCKSEHPGAAVVCYVNSNADVKAESDYCCTSSNASAVLRAIPERQEILFVPDKNLGEHASQETGRNVILWDGHCPTHVNIQPEDVLSRKQQHPDAVVMVHPECIQAVRDLADEVLSTGGMCAYALQSDAKEFIVGTEQGLLHRLRQENRDKAFFLASDSILCPDMKRITLDKVLESLQEMKHEVRVPEETRVKARAALDRMLRV